MSPDAGQDDRCAGGEGSNAGVFAAAVPTTTRTDSALVCASTPNTVTRGCGRWSTRRYVADKRFRIASRMNLDALNDGAASCRHSIALFIKSSKFFDTNTFGIGISDASVRSDAGSHRLPFAAACRSAIARA